MEKETLALSLKELAKMVENGQNTTKKIDEISTLLDEEAYGWQPKRASAKAEAYGAGRVTSMTTKTEKTFSSNKNYRSLFSMSNLSNDGFQNFEGWIEHAVEGRHPNLRAMSEGVPADGGLLVPSEFAADVLDVSLEAEIVRPRATVWPMKSATRKVPGFVIGDHSDNLYGGIVGTWAGEASTLTQTEPSFRQIELNARKLTCYGIYSNELGEDSQVPFQEVVAKAVPGALAWYLDKSFLKGSGVGQALGIKNSACLISVARTTANNIVYTDLTSMLSRLYPGSFSNAVWVAHPTTIPELLGLTITVGDGGSHYPVLNESNGKFTMLSLPVIFSEKMSTLGSAFDILLADFTHYVVGIRREVRLDFSQHLLFRSDQMAYRAIIRVDGQPSWNQALTLEDGTTTVSPFVSLTA